MTILGPADLPAPPQERMTFAEYVEWLAVGLPPLTEEQAQQSAETSAAICAAIVKRARNGNG